MRILPAPDKKVSSAGSRETLESIVALSRPQRAIMDFGRMKGHDCLDIRMKSGTNGQVPAWTNAETPDATVASWMTGKKGQRDGRIFIKGLDLLRILQFVPQSEPWS